MNQASRLEKAKALFKEECWLLEKPLDLSYITGIPLSAGKLLFTPKNTYLIVDGRYYERAKEEKAFTVLLETEGTLQKCLEEVKTLHFDGSHLSWERVQELMKKSPHLKWASSADPLKKLRAVKEPWEVERMKKAAALGSKGFDYLLTQLKEGVTEKELASKLHLYWIQNGGKGLAFEPIIAFGPHAALPHHRPDNTPLKRGDTVLIDIGVVYDDYHSDMTRTVFFGDPSEKMREIYGIVKEAHQEALKLARAGAKPADLDKRARDVIEKYGYGDFYTHGLGHGVGLEIHEWPYLKNRTPYLHDVLEENMCVTIEPGIYLPGEGGVRIEDTYLIQPQGATSLTDRPQELWVVSEALSRC